MKKILEIENQNKIVKNLFKNCVFYISREVPSELFGLAIMSSGGVYGDDSENTPIAYVCIKKPINVYYIENYFLFVLYIYLLIKFFRKMQE